MTDIILNLVKDVNDLKFLSEIYKRGEIKLNISKLARELKVSRKTIRNKLNDIEVKKDKQIRKKYLDDYKEIIIELLTDKFRIFEYKQHLYNYLVREHKISCSRSNFSRYINNDTELKNLFKNNSNKKFTERFETAPGQQAQFDLKEKVPIVLKNGGTVRINIATLTLGFSRYNIRRVVLDTKYETIKTFLAECFELLGGVTKELVIDNIKCLVDKARGKNGEPAILNPKFIEFLKDYNITCKPCMPYRPETKGKTETQNKKPSQIQNYSGTFKDMLEVHEKVEMLNDEDNYSVSQATKLPRIFLLNKEKDDFSPLPNKKIREKYHLSINEVAVSNESLVSYKSNKYSVPKSLIGTKVNLIVKNNQLHIYYNTKIIVIHEITNNLLNIHEQHNLKYEEKEEQTIDTKIIKEELENLQYD